MFLWVTWKDLLKDLAWLKNSKKSINCREVLIARKWWSLVDLNFKFSPALWELQFWNLWITQSSRTGQGDRKRASLGLRLQWWGCSRGASLAKSLNLSEMLNHSTGKAKITPLIESVISAVCVWLVLLMAHTVHGSFFTSNEYKTNWVMRYLPWKKTLLQTNFESNF